ncbi:MAG: hypothetical protein WBD15_19110, partial [Pseudolabrys sp.]
VERQPHAERLEADHCGLGRVDIAEQHAFCEFELKPRRIEIRVLQEVLLTDGKCKATPHGISPL